MKKVVASPANQPRSLTSRNVAWTFAALLTIMAVGQLFSFEKFIPIIENYSLPGGHGTAMIIASTIVITEVFALPFLLRMNLSPLMRWLSLGSGLAAAGLWLGLAMATLLNAPWVQSSGMFGTKIIVTGGIASLTLSLMMGVLAIWSATGLWPDSEKE